MGAIERVVAKWRADGIANPGAAPETIDRLERQVGDRLPADVRRFFASADGTEDGCMDEHHMSFWSIEKVIGETAELRDSGHGIDTRDTPVADFLIDSWFLFLRRLGEGRIGVWVEGVGLELESLEAFFERYEADPDSLGL